MNPTQKRNKRVDEAKDRWARLMGVPLIRIWEHDIHKNKEKVMKMLSQHIKEAKEREIIKENKKKRH